MKNILNLSLGSSKRDFEAVFDIQGHQVKVKRIGLNGDNSKFILFASQLTDYDAVAIGGINSAYHFEDKYWLLKEYQKLISNIPIPVFDGLWVKEHYETYKLNKILTYNPKLKNKKWLVFSVLDRYKCYELLRKMGIQTTIGDTYSALGIPISLKHNIFKYFANCLMPLFIKLPIKSFYPHKMQHEERELGYLNQFDVILSETNFLLNKKPLNLKNKTIILSRLSQKEEKILHEIGVQAIYELLPGEILSANIIEAMVGVTIGFNHEADFILKQIDKITRLI